MARSTPIEVEFKDAKQEWRIHCLNVEEMKEAYKIIKDAAGPRKVLLQSPDQETRTIEEEYEHEYGSYD